MSATKRVDLDVQLRRKYMRMKAINDHEYSILNTKLGHLNKTTVNTLEQHRKDCVAVTSLWDNMTTITGWCKDAVKPMKKDFSGSLMSLRSQIRPWAYSSHGTIEDWEKYPSRYKTTEQQQRPKTAHPTTSSSQRDHQHTDEEERKVEKPNLGHLRPATASEERGQSKEEDYTDVEEKLALAAGLQTKKMHVVKPRPFHSPRLNDKHVKSTNRNLRPTTAGAKLGGSNSSSLGAAKVTRRLSSAVYSRFSSVVSDNAFADETDGVEEDANNKTGKTVIKIVLPQEYTVPMSSRDAGKLSTTARPKSVTFKRSSSVFSSASKSGKPKHRTRSKRSDWSDSSSDEECEYFGKKKEKENKQVAQEWKIPKFYVKPQDRYKVEDMFLMRRHTLLQRQIASEMPPNVAEDNEKLKIRPTFSAVAKRKLTNQLIEENNCQIKNNKKPSGQTGLNDRIQKFLRNIDVFIEDQTEE